MPISVLFQSTLPRRERPETNRNYMRTCINFNPHSHEGSDIPTTVNVLYIGYFNPHSHEGSDENLSTKRSVASTFQSTLPRRERLCHNYITPLYSSISIHTPTKGATLPRICKYRLNENFNPHSHEGSDL